MGMTRRNATLALGAAVAFGLLMPLALLLPATPEKSRPVEPVAAPIVANAPPALGAAYERPLFAAAPGQQDAAPADAPALVGVVGRLGNDAVALVRTGEGNTRTLRIGESVDGWSLASLAIDAAYFTRGKERVRVPLPTE